MARITRTLGSGLVALALALAGCLGAPSDEQVGQSQDALVGVEQQSCTRQMVQRYVECRELDCQRDTLVDRGYYDLCDRDCAGEAETVYRDCAEDAADATAWDGPTARETRQFAERPDDVVRVHAGPMEEPCLNCLR